MTLAPSPAVPSRRRRAPVREAAELLKRTSALVVGSEPKVRDGAVLLIGYVVYELACQLSLLIPQFAPARVVLRSAAFAASLALVFMVPGKALSWHPARSVVTLALTIVIISALNPAGAGPVASFANVCLYVSIVGPIFWMSRLRVREETLLAVLGLFWAYYTLSSAAGVLQMYYPGRFEPPIQDVLKARGEIYSAALKIQLASGEVVYRPMGLSDAPGGAAVAGFYAALLGAGVAQGRALFWGSRLVGVGSILLGIMVIYLSHVRSLLVALGVAMLVLFGLLGLSARFSRFLLMGGVVAVLAVTGYGYAVDVGGNAMVARMSTLVEQDPTDVYYSNRGIFLQHAFTHLLPEFPLGGGLGRWGMINSYFGAADRALWVEIQWSGWLIDGGVPLCIAFAAAMSVAILTAARIAMSRRTGGLGPWAAVIAAYAVGTAAMTFNAAPFAGTTGVEFWFILAALFQATYGPGGPLAAPSNLSV